MEAKGYFSKVCADSSQCDSSPAIRVGLPFLGTFFKEKLGQKTLSVPVDSQLPLAQIILMPK